MKLIRFLKEEELKGFKKSRIFTDEELGTRAIYTDLALLMGLEIIDCSEEYISEQEDEISTGTYYIDEIGGKGDFSFVVESDGEIDIRLFNDKSIGARPVMDYSVIKEFSNNKEELKEGVIEVEFGEFPQNIVNNLTNSILEEKYQSGELNKTGRQFTLGLEKKKYDEYELNGRKFIRYTCEIESESMLTNYETPQKGKSYFVEVEPIKFLVDEENDIAVTKYILFAGMIYTYLEYFLDEFEDSIIGGYLNNEFIKEISGEYLEQLIINKQIKMQEAPKEPGLSIEELERIIEEKSQNIPNFDWINNQQPKRTRRKTYIIK